MGKTYKDQIRKMEGKARRAVDIEMGFNPFRATTVKAHKSPKDFNRKRNKQINWD